jgi:hypothetical protein
MSSNITRARKKNAAALPANITPEKSLAAPGLFDYQFVSHLWQRWRANSP